MTRKGALLLLTSSFLHCIHKTRSDPYLINGWFSVSIMLGDALRSFMTTHSRLSGWHLVQTSHLIGWWNLISFTDWPKIRSGEEARVCLKYLHTHTDKYTHLLSLAVASGTGSHTSSLKFSYWSLKPTFPQRLVWTNQCFGEFWLYLVYFLPSWLELTLVWISKNA